MLLNEQGFVFAGDRAPPYRGWQMPQGGIDPGEDVATAALREMEEEVGTNKGEVVRISPIKRRYDFPPEVKARLGGPYDGQEQTWVAVRFTGAPSDINIDTAKPEFISWEWLKAEDLLNRIVAFKRATYVQVFTEFEDLLG